MPRQEQQLIAFNRGLISQLALARVDLKRAAFSAEVMTNWMPRTMGSMMLRPGLKYLGQTAANAASRDIPFVYRTDDTAICEFTDSALRVWVNDALVTRNTVSTAVTNGTFLTDLTGWTDSDEGGATSSWQTGGYMGLLGNGTAAAIRDQEVTVAGADLNVEQALRIVVQRGPVTLRVGSSSGADDYISETTLDTGQHSLALTPTGNFHIRFLSRLNRMILVDSCEVEAGGVMSIPSPYLEDDLDLIRGGTDSQSGDIIYLACHGYQQRKIERRATRSWSLVIYQTEDGPFRFQNSSPTTIAASALTGNITLTASASLFKSTHVGALWQIISTGQTVAVTVTGDNTWSNPIRVTGITSTRIFTINITGTWTGTVTLQRSLDSDTGPWSAVAGKTWTANTTETFDDGLDNQIAYYRIGCDAAPGWTSGTINASLTINVGSITGVARITGYTSELIVDAEVLTSLGGVAATDEWSEGRWSDRRGWPSSVSFHEGRLGWFGKDNMALSVSDLFDGFDAETEGDSGPINKTVGSGPVDVINWALGMQRLLLGGQGSVFSVRSSAFDEPLTPTNCNIKPCSTQGSAQVPAVRVDNNAVFVQRGGTRAFELVFSSEGYDYAATDLTQLIPEIGGDFGTTTHIVRIGVQRQPDTRIHFVRSDGIAAVLVYDKAENVLCWIKVSSPGAAGLIEDVVVLPSQVGQREDQVYYTVKRTIGGSTVRHRVKWALETDCVGGTLNKQADSFVEFTNSPASATVAVGSHLIGETVVCWFDGMCEADADEAPQTYVVDGSGNITLGQVATTGIVGLAYESQWQSAKLGQALTHIKNVNHIGLILANTHARGLKFGPTLTASDLDFLPLDYQGTPVNADSVYASYDDTPIPFDGRWETDARICLYASAPRPAAVMAAIVDGTVN